MGSARQGVLQGKDCDYVSLGEVMSTGSSCANGKDNRLALQYTRKERFLKITFCEQVRKEGMEVRKKDRTYSNLKKSNKN